MILRERNGMDRAFPRSSPFIRIQAGGAPQVISLEPGQVLVMGTDKQCDIVLPFGKKVFPRHASIECAAGSRIVRKLYEPATVFVNDLPVAEQQTLYDSDVIRLGEVVVEYGDSSTRKSTGTQATMSQGTQAGMSQGTQAAMSQGTQAAMSQGTQAKITPPAHPGLRDSSLSLQSQSTQTKKMLPTIPEHVLKEETITIGRDPANTVIVSHEMVSRFHSRVEYRQKAYHIVDLHSTNGTFLNGVMIQDSVLNKGDLIQIGDIEFVFDGKSLRQTAREGEARIDAINLVRTIGKKEILILNDISLSIYPRELVAIVGGSGAGKSTLMNALGGFSPADSGRVLVNSINFYKYFDAFRSSLGYVPQDDIIHKELSVFKALFYAASLRMPEDMRRTEREARIQQVLTDLQLTHRTDTVITQLSGGERKRVSIGVELLTRPRLFYLDEPTSGLDPGLEMDMMRIFRALADQGHTTVLITHATKNLGLCDQVIFLARGGYLAYFGPPADALRYFEADDFTDIYVKLERDKRPELWGRQFRNSVEYKTYVLNRLKEVNAGDDLTGSTLSAGKAQGAHPVIEKPPVKEKHKSTKGGARTSQFRQFTILSTRYIEILVRDTRNFGILLFQAPLIGVLLSLVYGTDIFNKTAGNYAEAKSLLFFLICICIWFGTSNSAREIAKEIAIYRRERFINLGIAPYIFSKVAVLSLLCIIQTSVLLGIICLKVKFPDLGFPMYRDIFIAMVLTSLDSMVMGLMISALVGNPDKAASIVPILLIPQIVFSGAIIPLKGAAEIVSYFTLSRWGFELMGHLTETYKVPLVTTPVLRRSSEGVFEIIQSTHWIILLCYLAIFILCACLFQRLKDYSRVR